MNYNQTEQCRYLSEFSKYRTKSEDERSNRFITKVEYEHAQRNIVFDFYHFNTVVDTVLRLVAPHNSTTIDLSAILNSRFTINIAQEVIDYVGAYVLIVLIDCGWDGSTYSNSVLTRA